FPHNQSAAGWFAGKPETPVHALRNGSLQGAYFILAARAIGLDCGPMSGFDNARVAAAFFPEGRMKLNFLCNLRHGDPSKIFERLRGFGFDEGCRIVWQKRNASAIPSAGACVASGRLLGCTHRVSTGGGAMRTRPLRPAARQLATALLLAALTACASQPRDQV